MRTTADFEKFYYLFPQSVVLIGVARNLMPAAWHTPISAKPPLYGALISPKRYTYKLLTEEKGFTVNFLMHENAPLVAKLGSTSGRDIDKLTQFKIATHVATKVNAPIISTSYAAYECEKCHLHEYGDHFLLVGRVLLIHFDQDVLHDREIVDVKKVSPMLYFGTDRYITTDPDTLSIYKRK